MRSGHHSPINYNTQPTVFQCNCPGECNRDDACDLYSAVPCTNFLTNSVSQCVHLFSYLILRCTQGCRNLSQLSWGHDRLQLTCPSRGRQRGTKKKKTHLHSHLWTILHCQSNPTCLSLGCRMKSKEDPCQNVPIKRGKVMKYNLPLQDYSRFLF